MVATLDTIYRVVPLSSTLRDAMRKTREAKEITTCDFVAEAVGANLGDLVKTLQTLGFSRSKGPRGPVRLPFDRNTKVLERLREASAAVQVPAVQLLAICLARAAGEAKAPRGGRRAGKKSKKAASSGRRRSPKAETAQEAL